MDRWVDHDELASQTGIVIPAYFSAKPSDKMVRQLLWMTLADTPHYFPLDQTCVVVDGDPRTAALVRNLATDLRKCGRTFRTLVLPQNQGKFGAIREGIAALLSTHPGISFVAIRDSDGDHAISEVPSLVRIALRLAEAYGHTRVITVGSRRSRIHPMGWLRGELEELLDRVTLDSLAYSLAQEGRALDLCNCLGQGKVPDLSSGFKVYGREIAELLFVDAEPQYATLSPEDYWHFGPETVTFVEATLQGAVLAEKLRQTWDGQPATSFGEFRHVALYGELLAWAWARLEIPLSVAGQFYDNHVPPMALRTTVEGRDLLDQVRQYALTKVWSYRGKAESLPSSASGPSFL